MERMFQLEKTYSLHVKYDLKKKMLKYCCVFLNIKWISSADGSQLASLLSRMCLPSAHAAGALRVRVPPSRHDVIHACDLYEDVAIAYG